MNGESGQRKHINNKNNNFNKKQLEKYAKLILKQITLNIKLLKLLEYNSCNIDKEKCKLFIHLHAVYNNKKTLYNAFGIHLYNESKCLTKSNQELLLTKSNQKLNSLTNNDGENGTVVDKLKNLIDDICTLSNIITNFFENLTNENLTKLQYLDPPMRQIEEPIDFTPDNIIETSSTNINKSNIAEENAIIEDNNTIANSSINNEIKHYLNKDINENHGNELSSKNGDITFSNLILQNNQNLSSELNHGNELLSKNGDITFSNLILQNNQNLSDELNQENEIVFVDKGNDFSMSSI